MKRQWYCREFLIDFFRSNFEKIKILKSQFRAEMRYSETRDCVVKCAEMQGVQLKFIQRLDYKTFKTERTKTQMAINTVHLLHPTEKTDASSLLLQ
jgi:hypothetical protein